MGGMGIAYKDLVAGRYYKGTLDNGSKVYLFIESVSPLGGNVIGVSLCRYERRSNGAGWLALGANVTVTEDSRMRREVSRAEVVAEGIPRAPMDKGLVPTPAPKATTSSGTKAASSPSKPPSLRKDGTPKAAIEENKTATTCLHCKRPTKTMTLFQFSNQWCPDCEP
jgi:hypothetical protein